MPRELTGSAVSHHILKANCLQRDLPKCVAMNMASFLMGNSWRLLLTYCFGVASCCVHRCKFHKNKGDYLLIPSSHKRETIFLSHSHTQGKPSSYPILTLKGNYLQISPAHAKEIIFLSIFTLKGKHFPIPSSRSGVTIFLFHPFNDAGMTILPGSHPAGRQPSYWQRLVHHWRAPAHLAYGRFPRCKHESNIRSF